MLVIHNRPARVNSDRGSVAIQDRKCTFMEYKEFEPIGGKRTLRPQLIEAGGSTEVWYGESRSDTLFGVQPPWPVGTSGAALPDCVPSGRFCRAKYGGDDPCRGATPCFGTQPNCLQVQLARHCRWIKPGCYCHAKYRARRSDKNQHLG